jgi:hypothetical protein
MGAVTLAHGINAIRPATVRMRGLVLRTPLLAAAPTKEQPQAARGLLLKLKALQVTGSSVKSRNAVNGLLAQPSARLQRVRNRFGWQSRARGGPSRLGGRNTSDDFLPSSVASDKLSKFAAWAAPEPMA